MDRPKEVMRTIELGETDWEWLSGWLDALIKTMDPRDLSPDLLRMVSIARIIREALRDDEV